jgi:hypothetical protein
MLNEVVMQDVVPRRQAFQGEDVESQEEQKDVYCGCTIVAVGYH